MHTFSARNAKFSLVFAAIALFSGSASAQTQAIDGVAALVEDDVILQSELASALGNIRRQYRDKEDQLPPMNVLEKQLLERLIIGKLQVLRAEETGVQVTDTEIDQAVSRVADGNKLTVPQLAAALEQDGLRLSDFRQTMRDELLVQKLRGRIGQSRSDVSESEVDILMNSGQLKSGEIELAHVMVALPDNASAEQLELANKKITGVKKLIDDQKMEFSAAAIRYSDAENALEGGVIGWRRLDQIPGAFAEVLARMQKGDVSEPIRSQAGLHLLRINNTRDQQQVMVTEYSARHILIRVDELTSDALAEKNIRGVYETLNSGGKFADQAKKFSEDAQTAAIGGDMGWFDLEAYGTTYAQKIDSLKDGETSEPFRTEQGWHIVKRVGKREQDRTADYARNQARESIRQRKAEEAYQSFVRQLRNESFVEVRLDGKAVETTFETEAESEELEKAKRREQNRTTSGQSGG
jgi:peptidyl-prolyl cis-trans isomerase SurA